MEIKNHKWRIMSINLVIIKVKVDSSVIWSMIFTELANWKFKICNRKGTPHIKVSFIDDLYATISVVLLFSRNVKRKVLKVGQHTLQRMTFVTEHLKKVIFHF